MPQDVWLEWQEAYNLDPWDGIRADHNMAIGAHNVYIAIHSAMSRVLAYLGSKEQFDYRDLPSPSDLLPEWGGKSRKDTEKEDEAALGPMQPDEMTRQDWEDHLEIVRNWQMYIDVRTRSRANVTPQIIEG